MNITEAANSVETRDDLVSFVRALRCTLDDQSAAWEHQNLSSYLDALAAWIEDMDGYFQHRGEPLPVQPSWKLLGQILAAARVYE